MAKETVEMRVAYANKMAEIADKDDRIVLIDADLMAASKTGLFKEKHPDRFVDVGVAEANMMGVAAGLAASGMIPFTHSFTPFATRRCFDQITVSIAYPGLNVKMIGSDPGVSAQLNGGTHMSFEDVALMRSLGTMTIFEPIDIEQLEQGLPEVIKINGPVYIRMFRKITEKIFDKNYKLNWGKGDLLTEGNDISIIASGIMVKEALDAAEILKAEGINARVIAMHLIKPIDQEIIIKAAKETGAIVTAENHSILNGLGSAVSEIVVENVPVPMERIGVKDHFGEVGKLPFLMEKYEMMSSDIVKACKRVIDRK